MIDSFQIPCGWPYAVLVVFIVLPLIVLITIVRKSELQQEQSRKRPRNKKKIRKKKIGRVDQIVSCRDVKEPTSHSSHSSEEESNNDDVSNRSRPPVIQRNKVPLDGHITWPEYFMSVAQLASRRSKDPSTKVGACIVNEHNKIIATGYNGMPNGIDDDKVSWEKEGEFLYTKYAYVVHAELNAILNSVLTDQTGCKLFVSLFPCNECTKAIIQTGIKQVVYLSDKHKDKDSTKASKRMLNLAGVRFEQFHGRLLIS